MARATGRLLGALIGCLPVASLAAQPTAEPPRLGGPVQVSLDVSINEILDIDMRNETFRLDGYLRATWLDPRLSSEADPGERCPRLYEGPAATRQLGEEIWWPAFELINVVGSSTVPHRRFYVHCDGTVEYYERFVAVFATEMALAEFPFDTQTFRIEIESYPYDRRDTVFASAELDHGRLHEDALFEWKILDGRSTIVEQVYGYRSDAPEPITFSRCVLSIVLERKSRYYVWHLLVPLGSIVGISWVVFWLPDFATQLRTAISLLLTIVAFGFTTGNLLPRISYATFLDLLMISGHLAICAGICAVSMAHVAKVRGWEALGERIVAHCRWAFPLANLVAVALLTLTVLGE